MRPYGSILTALFFLAPIVAPVEAQVLQPPPRPYRGLFGGGPSPDPTRTRQELTLRGNLLGGRDDNLAPPGTGEAVDAHPSGYLGFGDAMLRYWFGRDVRWLDVSARGYTNSYRNIGVTPSYGGDMSARARTTVGRMNEIALSENVRYAPFFSLGVFAPLADASGPDNPDANPTNALRETGSWANEASAAFSRRWTRKTRTEVGYSFNQQTYLDDAAFDSRVHGGQFAVERSIGRTVGIRAAYRRFDGEFTPQHADAIRNLSQTTDVGLLYQRRLSLTRQVSMGAGAGALHLDTVDAASRQPIKYWAPSGYATVRLDFARSWGVSGDYRRSLTVLQGVAPATFVTHAGTVTAGGYLARWLEGVVTTAYSNGIAGQQTADGLGKYDGLSGSAQLRFRLLRWWSSVVSVNHYRYHLNDAASRSLRITPSLDRTAIRVGFSWLLPLYGSTSEQAEPPGSPRN